MTAVLWVKLCLGICFIQPAARLPQQACFSQQGQMLALQFAEQMGMKLEDWSCQIEQEV